MNNKKNSQLKKSKHFLIISLFIVIIMEIFFIFILKYYALQQQKKEKNLNLDKNISLKIDNKYVLYQNKKNISLKDLNNSTIFYKDSITLKLIDGKLKIIAEFGNSSISPKEEKNLLKLIENIKNAQNIKKIKTTQKPIAIISGNNYYINIITNKNCVYYIISDNNRKKIKYFKYCKGENHE